MGVPGALDGGEEGREAGPVGSKKGRHACPGEDFGFGGRVVDRHWCYREGGRRGRRRERTEGGERWMAEKKRIKPTGESNGQDGRA